MLEQNSPEQQTPQDQISHLKPVHHRYWIPIVVIAALVAGYLMVTYTQEIWPFPSENDEYGMTNDESEQEIDTAGWQTYRNEEYGFEFKYPEDWHKAIRSNAAGEFKSIIFSNFKYDIEEQYFHYPYKNLTFSINVDDADLFTSYDSKIKNSYLDTSPAVLEIVKDGDEIWLEGNLVKATGIMTNINIATKKVIFII